MGLGHSNRTWSHCGTSEPPPRSSRDQIRADLSSPVHLPHLLLSALLPSLHSFIPILRLLLQIFEKLWGTNKLACSFDGGSLMLPGIKAKEGEGKSWQHIDMCPSRVGFFCAQGLVNLNDNGPEDGGLIVMKGSSRLQKQFFDIHGRPPIPDERLDWHMFSNEDKAWFEEQGCEWIKVDAKAGDMIIWDSATMHQNRPPSGKNDRMVTCEFLGSAFHLGVSSRRYFSPLATPTLTFRPINS